MDQRRTSKPYAPEVRERAVRLVLSQQAEHGSQWAAMCSIAGKIGCTTDERTRLKELERENRELRQPNEILRKGERMNAIGPSECANAYFAQAELDRPLKR